MPKAGKVAAAAAVGLILAATSHHNGGAKASASSAEATPAPLVSTAPAHTAQHTAAAPKATTAPRPASTASAAAARRRAAAAATASARARAREQAAADRRAAGERAAAAFAKARATKKPSAPPKPSGPVRVVLWGDSLSFEAQDHFVAALAAHGHADVRLRTFGGTALCDWVQDVKFQIAAFHPQVAVIEFAGNAATPCMRGANGAPLTGSAFVAAYRRAGDTVLDDLHGAGVRVFWASAPEPRPGKVGGPEKWATDDVNGLARSLTADHPGSSFFPAGLSVLSGGKFTDTLPCRSGEPCTARNASGNPAVQVRSKDGVHFCPGPYVGLSCGVYSGGAVRYGEALAEPVIRDYL